MARLEAVAVQIAGPSVKTTTTAGAQKITTPLLYSGTQPAKWVWMQAVGADVPVFYGVGNASDVIALTTSPQLPVGELGTVIQVEGNTHVHFFGLGVATFVIVTPVIF